MGRIDRLVQKALTKDPKKGILKSQNCSFSPQASGEDFITFEHNVEFDEEPHIILIPESWERQKKQIQRKLHPIVANHVNTVKQKTIDNLLHETEISVKHAEKYTYRSEQIDNFIRYVYEK